MSIFLDSTSTKRPKKNYELLEERANSVAQELAIVEQQIERYQDASQGIFLRAD